MNIAVVDVDGTLYQGTLGFALLDELNSADLVSASAVHRVRNAMRQHRGAGKAFRTTLESTSDCYARAVEGVPQERILAASHAAWQRVRHRLLDSAGPLIEILEKGGFVPVLISGSPQEMIDRIADELGISHRFGMRLAVDNGVCTHRFLSLPAIPEVKVGLLRELASQLNADMTEALAIGNGASDYALLHAVGHPIAFEPDETLRCMARHGAWTVADRRTLVPQVSALVSPSRPSRRTATAPGVVAVSTVSPVSPVSTVPSERNLDAYSA
ncbi:HAD family phosphatase [Streptomyces sp. A 4/2]|uniref:HAD family hydrolase n=1 Tax=Streptomyces sp. A 4/2 TaxID=2934314 RepID=UPI0020253BAB|nr:HAD-IB family phosphatase [Streptomyces sp. A 4/2]